MLVLNQFKYKIVNFSNLTQIYISKDDKKNYIRFETINGLYDDLGEYATEERAKEVLQEIFKVYRLNKMFECSDRIEQAQTLQAILKENMQPFTYEMPEK